MDGRGNLVAFRKHFAGCSHGHRFTYSVRAQDPKFVHWRRSDGLEGRDTIVDWARLYTSDNDNVVAPPKPVPKRETRLAKKAEVKTKPPLPAAKPMTEAEKRAKKARADKGRKR